MKLVVSAHRMLAGPPLREAEIGEQVKSLLRKTGWVVYSLSQGRKTRQTPGLPDLYCLHPSGRPAFWVELKSPTGTSSVHQDRFRDLCGLAGVGYVVGGTVAVLEHLDRIGAR